MKKLFTIIALFVLVHSDIKAQTADSSNLLITSSTITQGANKAKTGQANDLLTNFYQLAIKNVFGDKKHLSYSSTIFGLLNSATNNLYTSDTRYGETRWARNIQLSISGAIDSNNSIASYGGGVKFYLMNKRDITNENKPFQNQMQQYVGELQHDLGLAMRKCLIPSAQRTRMFDSTERVRIQRTRMLDSTERAQMLQCTGMLDSTHRAQMRQCISQFLESIYGPQIIQDVRRLESSRTARILASKVKYDTTFNVKDLDWELVDTLRKMHSKVILGKGLADSAKNYFYQQINLIKKKPLWSIGGTYLHSIQNKSDTTTIKSDFLVGLGKNNPDNFWEFSVSTYLQLFNNRAPQSTASQKFHFETGFNKILSENSAGESNMELKFFGSYDKVFNTTTIPTTTTANLTYRYLVSRLGGFWIPVTLSYDPDKGKFLGFIDLTFNIDPKK